MMQSLGGGDAWCPLGTDPGGGGDRRPRHDVGVADGAGLTNRQEFVVGTSPLIADSDHDGTVDGDEDTDGDGLDNHDEFRLGENPNDPDSDHDGTTDGSERAGTIMYYNDVAHSMY